MDNHYSWFSQLLAWAPSVFEHYMNRLTNKLLKKLEKNDGDNASNN